MSHWSFKGSYNIIRSDKLEMEERECRSPTLPLEGRAHCWTRAAETLVITRFTAATQTNVISFEWETNENNCTVPSYWWNSSARCTRGGRLPDRRPAFPPALQNAHSVPDKRRLNYTLEEEGGILVPWYSLCDSFNAFQSWDYFFLSCQTASWMKGLFYHFFIFFTFNSPTLSPSIFP